MSKKEASKAELLLSERTVLDEISFVDVKVWKVPSPVLGSRHEYKYSLAYVEGGACALRFDNERGKGDHFHLAEQEKPYEFTTLASLYDDFWALVDQLRSEP